LIVALIFIAFLSLSEAAVVGADRVELQALAEKGDKRARKVQQLLENPERFISALIMGVNLGMLVASHVLALLVHELHSKGLITASPKSLELYVSLGAAAVIVLCCEIIPKSYAAVKPVQVALASVHWLGRSYRLLHPLAVVFESLSGLLVRLLGGKPHRVKSEVTSEEIKDMVSLGEAAGSIQPEERDMIYGILEFSDMTAHDVMVPRTDVVSVEASEPLQKVLDLVTESGHTRLPVYEEEIDNLLGVVHYRDAARALQEGRGEEPVRNFVRQTLIVPETMRVSDLLRELRMTNNHMALVVEEHGGFEGVVTIEDILEEIVGEITDEHDEEAEEVRAELDGTLQVKGQMDLEDFEQFLGVKLPEGDYETLAGLVIDKLGHLPKVGETVQIAGLELQVKAVDRNRVETVQVRPLPSFESSTPQEG